MNDSVLVVVERRYLSVGIGTVLFRQYIFLGCISAAFGCASSLHSQFHLSLDWQYRKLDQRLSVKFVYSLLVLLAMYRIHDTVCSDEAFGHPFILHLLCSDSVRFLGQRSCQLVTLLARWFRF